MVSILHKLLPWKYPTAIEAMIIRYIVEKLPEAQGSLLSMQFNAVWKFHRIDKRREVNLYYRRQGSHDIPPKLKFDEASPGEYLLANLRLSCRSTGHGSKVKVWLVRGHLFSIEFSLPPGDLIPEDTSIAGDVFPLRGAPDQLLQPSA